MGQTDCAKTLLRQQTILARFGELALKSESLEECLQEACHLVGQALGTDLAKVMELQEDGITLLARAGVGWKPGVVGKVTVKADKDSSEGHALQTGNPVISTNIDTEGRFQYADFIKDNGVKALVNVAIIGAQDKLPYGILQVDSRTPRDFTEDDINFLRGYANLLAATVERLRALDEMRDTQAKLRESEEQCRISVELHPQIRWTASPDGLLSSVDARWLELTGQTREAVISAGWLGLSHRADREEMAAAWERSLKTGAPYNQQARLLTASGHFVWHQLRAFPRRDSEERIIKWYGTVENIEERHQLEVDLRESNETLEARVVERTRALENEQHERQIAEEKLHQSQKMDAVGQLTGGLAHDFNNMLAGIVGNLELMQMRLAQGQFEGIERYAQDAMRVADRATALTHRLLAFSRRQTLDPKPTDVNRLVRSMEDLIRRTLGPSIFLETVLDDGLANCFCDPNQLESTLLNLAINSRDAMPNGGRLTIQTSNVVLDAEHPTQNTAVLPRQYIQICISDTGVGMTPAILSSAVEPFFTTKPIGQGTGLGLSMVDGFVHQSKGNLRIASEPGSGTTIHILLPRHLGTTQQTLRVSNASSAPRAASELTVLLVDDEASIRNLSIEVLRDLGYNVLAAVDGREALKLLESDRSIDLLVSDVGLPNGMNGRQLADAARIHRPSLKVLFITGFAETASIRDGLLATGMQVMTKPFSMVTFAGKVRSMIAEDDSALSK